MKPNSKYKLTRAQRRAKFTPKKYKKLRLIAEAQAEVNRIEKSLGITEETDLKKILENPVSYKFSTSVSKPAPGKSISTDKGTFVFSEHKVLLIQAGIKNDIGFPIQNLLDKIVDPILQWEDNMLIVSDYSKSGQNYTSYTWTDKNQNEGGGWQIGPKPHSVLADLIEKQIDEKPQSAANTIFQALAGVGRDCAAKQSLTSGTRAYRVTLRPTNSVGFNLPNEGTGYTVHVYTITCRSITAAVALVYEQNPELSGTWRVVEVREV